MERHRHRRQRPVRAQLGLPGAGPDGSQTTVAATEIAALLDQATVAGRAYLEALSAVDDRDGDAEAILVAWRAGLPFTELRELPDAGTRGLLSAAAARSLLAVPLSLEGGAPLVAVADVEDDRAARLTAALGTRPRLVVAPRARLRAVLGEGASNATEAAAGGLLVTGSFVARPGLPARAFGPVVVEPHEIDRIVVTPPAGDRVVVGPPVGGGDGPTPVASGEPPPVVAAGPDGEQASTPEAPAAAASRNAGLGARAAKGVLWTAAGNWGTQAATFAVFVVLSRLLDPASFGLVALAAVFVGLVQLIANQGMLDALVQRRTLDPEHLDTAFWTGLGVGLAAMALLAGLAYPIGLAVHQPRLAPVVAVLAISIPIGSTNLVQRALMTRDLAFRSLTVRTLVATAVGSVAGIGAAVAGLGVWSLVVQNLANVVAGAVVLWTLTPWRPRLRFSRAHFRDLFGYGVHVVSFKILNYFSRKGDDLLIGSFLGSTALGLYSVAYRILTMIIDVTTNLIDSVAFPVYARLQDEPEKLREAYHRTSGYVALVSFPVFAGILVLAPQIVEVCFGEKWVDSAPVMQALSLVGCLQAVNYLNSTMLKALGKPSWRVVLSGITMLLSLIAFLAVVRHGILAVAIALVVVGYVSMPLSYVAIHRLLPLSPVAYLSHLAGPVLGSLAVAGAAYGAREALDGRPAAVVLAAGIAAGAVAYGISIALVARPLAREILRLLQSALGRSGGGPRALGAA